MASASNAESTIRYVDTLSAYDRWANVYDTDGNFLVALDTLEMRSLLPAALALVETPKPWKVVDLGCGTGRNTIHLASVADAEILALDLSPNMLELARKRLDASASSLSSLPKVQFATFDILGWDSSTALPAHGSADLIVSTLVVEHIPLERYFSTVSSMLKDGGILLLTNMHSEMGSISQAGFTDPETGEKIRPTSFAHTIEEILQESSKFGFTVAKPFEEIGINDENCSALGLRANKWMGVKVWYGGILRKTDSLP